MMSYRLYFSVFVMLATVFLFSCEDEPLDVGLDDGLPNLETGTISFKVDGEFMEYDGAATYREHQVQGPDGTTTVMKGWQILATDNSEALRLSIQLTPAELETGSFDITGLGEDSINIINYLPSTVEGQEIYEATSGRLRITDLNIEESGFGTMSANFNASLSLSTNQAVQIEIIDGRINNVPVIVVDDSYFDM